MSAYDFMPWKESAGSNVLHGPMNASESFLVGELVGINSDGEVAELPADGTKAVLGDIDVARICGIAMTSTTGLSTGAQISFYPADQGTLFITDNITDGSGTAVVPTGTMRGLAVTLEHNNSAWALIPGTAATFGTDIAALIVDVLDSTRTPISATDTTTGVYAVFQLVTATRG